MTLVEFRTVLELRGAYFMISENSCGSTTTSECGSFTWYREGRTVPGAFQNWNARNANINATGPCSEAAAGRCRVAGNPGNVCTLTPDGTGREACTCGAPNFHLVSERLSSTRTVDACVFCDVGDGRQVLWLDTLLSSG